MVSEDRGFSTGMPRDPVRGILHRAKSVLDINCFIFDIE